MVNDAITQGTRREAGVINLCHCLVEIAAGSNQSKIIQLIRPHVWLSLPHLFHSEVACIKQSFSSPCFDQKLNISQIAVGLQMAVLR